MSKKTSKLKILRKVLGSSSKSGEEYLFLCPKCEHHKKKLSINLNKDCWKCWVCEWSGYKLYRVIRKYGSFNDKRAWLELDDAIETVKFEEFKRKLAGEPEIKEKTLIELPPEFMPLATNNVTFDSMKARTYLKSRGVTKDQILKWKIGYASAGDYEGRVIIPSFDLSGELDYFVGRSYTKEWPPYKQPEASKDIVFNNLFVNWNDDVVIVEGVFDAMRAGNAVPILGSSLNEKSRLFQAIALHDTPVYIALDADAEKKSMRLIESLMKYGVEIYKVDTAGYKDVAEIPPHIWRVRKQEAQLMTTSSHMRRKLMSLFK